MTFQRLFRVATAVLSPALLGLATIFQPKARLDDHWSTSPTLVQTCEPDAPAPSGPGGPRTPATPASV